MCVCMSSPECAVFKESTEAEKQQQQQQQGHPTVRDEQQQLLKRFQ